MFRLFFSFRPVQSLFWFQYISTEYLYNYIFYIYFCEKKPSKLSNQTIISFKYIKSKLFIMLKAQASMEFLFTYGWAILAISVSIGALAYFNVANPDSLIRQRCDIGGQINCIEYTIYDNDTLHLRLRSEFNAEIEVINTEILFNNQITNYTNTFVLVPRRIQDVIIDLPSQSAVTDSSANIKLALYFNATGSSNTYRISGNIQSAVSRS